jgi:hypothetical protein
MSSLYNWIAPILQRHPASLPNRLLYSCLMLREPRSLREHAILKADGDTDAIYYVIRRHDQVGLFSHYVSTLGHIKRALSRGWVPIVDMMNAPNALISEREIGKVNGWEIYFEQPCGRSLADAAGSRSVVMSYVGATLDRPYQTPAFVMKPDPHLQAWRRLARKTIRFNPETASYLEKVSSSALDDGKSLGVLCRGTDYTALRPSRHPVQPSVEQVIDKAAETMRTHRCSTLFLATEDETVHARFKARFGDALRCANTSFSTFDGVRRLSETLPDDVARRRLQNLEYLAAVATLAKCPCFIGGMTSGTLGVFLLSEGFEFAHVWDLGVY